jgi:hypothetical protein
LLKPLLNRANRFEPIAQRQILALHIGEPIFSIFFGWLLALKVLIGLPFDLLGVAS